MTILNGKDRKIGMPHLPNVSDALDGLAQPGSLFKVVKTMLKTGEVYERTTPLSFYGVFQPMKPFAISIKPEGQRAWRWYTLHTKIGLPLALDDIVYYSNAKYRVAEIWDYNQFGYFEYHLVQDFSALANAAAMPNQAALNKFLQDLLISAPGSVTVDVSANIPDARIAKWALYAPSGAKLSGAVRVLTAAQVQVTAPAAGTYRLIGES